MGWASPASSPQSSPITAIPDGRDASRVVHPLADILRARLFAIACGWEDACDLDSLRFDPAFKLACGRPEAMEWCAANGVDYLFGLPGNTVLDRLVDEAACPDASPIRHLATALAGP